MQRIEWCGMVSLIGIHSIGKKCRDRNCKHIYKYRRLNYTINSQPLWGKKKKKATTLSQRICG